MSGERERRPGGTGAALRSTNLNLSNDNHRKNPKTAQPRGSVNTLDLVVSYILRGWAAVPIPLGEKGPVIPGWPTIRITKDAAAQYFKRPCNVGIILGAASGGLA